MRGNEYEALICPELNRLSGSLAYTQRGPGAQLQCDVLLFVLFAWPTLQDGVARMGLRVRFDYQPSCQDSCRTEVASGQAALASRIASDIISHFPNLRL